MKTVQKYKICRRLGPGVFEKCQTAKFVASEARHAKNMKNKRPKALSGYALQFVEKLSGQTELNIPRGEIEIIKSKLEDFSARVSIDKK